MQQLPETFKEVWARLEAGDELLSTAGDDEAMQLATSKITLGGVGDQMCEGELHARLRRQIRHSMHVMMQQSNPNSYYADIEHMAPT